MRLRPHSPVLSRPSPGARAVQIGLSSPVILSGLGADEAAFLASLEGGRPVPPAQARRFARVIAMVTSAAGWDQGTEPTLASVAVHGCGELGMAIAFALAHGGYDVALHDPAPVAVEPAGTYRPDATGTCAGAAASALASRGAPVRVGGGGEDLMVVVCTGAPDPAVVQAAMRAGVPHVLVVCDGEAVWVSHVVVPGSTACSRCRDVTLTRADAAWPSLALQLAGCSLASRRPTAPGLSLPAAAARAAARVACWVQRADAGVAELISRDGELTVVEIAPEPGCGCGAAGPVGDEVTARRARWRD